MIKRYIITVVSSVVLALSASASDRASLFGFREFLFGMSHRELRRVIPIKELKNENGNATLTAAQSLQIDGIRFQLSFRFSLARLEQINFQNVAETSVDICADRFGHMSDMVRSWYGEPDAPAARVAFSGIAVALNQASIIHSTYFGFRDGGRIRVSTRYFDQSCIQSIEFTKRRSGAIFVDPAIETIERRN